ncbi:MAG: prepilin peptidase [Firmicutes bacterium]|nr:prepilin peptidase [Bacillota bacterium]
MTRWTVAVLHCGLWLAVRWRYGMTPAAAIYALLLSWLVVLSLEDLRTGLLPNRLTLSGTVVGLACRWWLTASFWSGLGGWSLAVTIMGTLAAVSRGGIGWGDVKLMGLIGAFLGWRQTLTALLLGTLLGGLAGGWLLVTKRKQRRDTIPYGPFLAAGAILVVLGDFGLDFGLPWP